MTEGTKSYLIGCHQFLLHPIWVLMAWKLEYKSWPRLWQIICIFLHDIGICGRQYLSDDKAKKGHWAKGAHLSIWLFNFSSLRFVFSCLCCGEPLWDIPFKFIAGHTQESGFPESLLARADKRSWVVAPMWWLWWNYWIEWYGKGIGVTPPPQWKRLVAENLRKTKPIDSHQLYVENRKGELNGKEENGNS